ncbi:MAG: TonB-dependent receptor, partial [Novosphingobium sp.]|nr:TonB-dependent receptor [Novosphingobium sp.]
FAMGAMFGGQGRWSLGLFHTVQLSSTVLIAPGVPALDLLDGDALSGGGTPRHSLEFNGGAFHKGFGLFAQGSWNAPTRVRASGAPGSSDLRFGALAKVNLSLFADLGRMPKLTKKAKFFKGSRLALQFENLFDARQKVTDASGSVPLSYQPDYLDPRGRVVGISFRKLF